MNGLVGLCTRVVTVKSFFRLLQGRKTAHNVQSPALLVSYSFSRQDECACLASAQMQKYSCCFLMRDCHICYSSYLEK